MCEACQLQLEGAGELEVAGIDLVMDNDSVSEGDVFKGFEPDEDWARDR